MKNKSLILLLLCIVSACHKLEKTNKAENQIEPKDLLGFWKMDSLNKVYCVLYFSTDTLLYLEDKYFRGVCYYKIDSINNIYILNNERNSISYINNIRYLDDSILILNNVLNIKGIRIYRKFDAVGKQLWEVNENKAY